MKRIGSKFLNLLPTFSDGTVRDKLNQVIGGAKVRLTYSKHLDTLDSCPPDNKTSDEIINVELIDEVPHS